MVSYEFNICLAIGRHKNLSLKGQGLEVIVDGYD